MRYDSWKTLTTNGQSLRGSPQVICLSQVLCLKSQVSNDFGDVWLHECHALKPHACSGWADGCLRSGRCILSRLSSCRRRMLYLIGRLRQLAHNPSCLDCEVRGQHRHCSDEHGPCKSDPLSYADSRLLKLRNLHTSHTLGYGWYWNTLGAYRSQRRLHHLFH